MSKLKMLSETVHVVDCFDLDDFIGKVTGHAFECCACEEWGNDSDHTFHVDREIDKHDKKAWSEFKKTGGYNTYALRSILQGLCNEDHIPAGKYLISVCW